MQLRSFVRDIAARRPRSQPDVIAAAVVKNTPPEMVLAFYEQALRMVVPDLLRLERNTAIAAMRRPPSTRQSVSANVAAIRSVKWENIFRSKICTGTGWKLVGDCTADDLDFCAVARRKDAALVVAQAEFYEDLALRMRKAGVETARELDPEDLP